jgi:hypothetical protein
MKSMSRFSTIPFQKFLCVLGLIMVGNAASQTIDAYIGQLVKPGTGDDSKPRLEIRTKTNFTFRAGAESERQSQEALLLTGLTKMTDWEVRAYLMDEIRFGGKLASIPVLAPYLNDANLCEPATMALMSIGITEGADKIIPVIHPALISSTGKCSVTLMRAAGSLRDGDASTINFLLSAANNPDLGTRFIALRGLANIGDIRATTVLAEAIKSTNMLDHYQAVDLNLLFAIRLAQKGLKIEATAIANSVKTGGTSALQKNVVIHADSILDAIKVTVVALHARIDLKAARVDLRNSRGKIWVGTPDGGPFSIQIQDLRGKIVRRFTGTGPGDSEFSLGSIPVGMYWMSWDGPSGTVSKMAFISESSPH